MKTDQLFKRPQHWGLRGDPYLWDELKFEFDSITTPVSVEAFKELLYIHFNKLTGYPISTNHDIYVEKYAHGGMSSGMVCIENWRNHLLPLLEDRFKNLNDHTMLVEHKFKSHTFDINTEILIVGTFNPAIEENKATFFYGRSRNYLWTLLPTAFGQPDLKYSEISEKKKFIGRFKIDFIDLIARVQVDDPLKYDDHYLDARVIDWNDVLSTINKLDSLKKVCLTRKTFNDIPNMKQKVEEIRSLCTLRNIPFFTLTTPARYINSVKQNEWTTVFRS